MAIGTTRVKVAIHSSWKGRSKINWRDAIAVIEYERLVIKYITMGEVVGEDTFSFSALTDVGIKIPGGIKLDPEQEHFGLKFYLETRGEVTVILTIGKNLLIYDEARFRDFIHKLFEVLIDSVPVKIELARIRGGALNMETKWLDGNLKILSYKSPKTGKREINIVITTQETPPIPIFSDMEDLEIEEVEMNGKPVSAWKIKHFYDGESVVSYLYIPEKKVKLYILRYLLKYGGGNILELLLKAAEEFPNIKMEFQEELERELKELDELDEMEKQLLMALYSGVDPLEAHEFLGISERELEDIYDRLIDKGILKIVRIRKVVDLTKNGKKIVNKLVKYGMGML